MFGALNRFIGRLDSDPAPQSSGPGNIENSYGFQALRNTNTELPIEPWFDFVIGINGRLIEDPNPHLFSQEIRNCVGSSVSLDIWSAKGQQTHRISVPVPASNPSLGLTLQLSPLSSTQNIWHILSIPSPLSPAFQAGLLPHSDYILGTPSGTLRGESAFGELVEDHLNRSLVLWVYNSEFDVVREVELVPRRGWGGDGALGAVLGYGALHRLPVGLGEEVQGPGESLFEASTDDTADQLSYSAQPAQFLSPSNDAPSSIPPPPFVSPSAPASTSNPAPARPGRKQRNHAAPSPSKAFDDYFAEGEKKSQEEDFAPSRKIAAVPPPPKVGAQHSTSPPPETRSPPPID